MKKFISLFLVFSLVMLSANLYAKERRGVTLIIQRKSDQVKKTKLEGTPWETSVITGIRGELIAVKQDSLLLLDAEGKDVSINIADIKVIRIVKKSKFWKGAGTGALIGVVTGALWGAQVGENDLFSAEATVLVDGIFFGVIGLLIGGVAGAVSRTDKTIQIEGMTDSELHAVMEKLRKKARIRD